MLKKNFNNYSDPWTFAANLFENLLENTEQKIPVKSTNINSQISKPEISMISSIFNGKRIPQITVTKYLQRIRRFSNCHENTFIIALFYLQKLFAKHNTFILTKLNVHRLLISSILISIKYNEDLFYPNSFYASIGGLHLKELNKLEANLLFLLDFDLYVQNDDLTNFMENMLMNFWKNTVNEMSIIEEKDRKNEIMEISR